ncbi:unnamed protein product [Peniophora sp. CBMAI 1063]|nr:unnamed protein product [Peniophora sp. CBMAI 1063]
MADRAGIEVIQVEKLAFSLLGETYIFALYAVLIGYLVVRRRAARRTITLPVFILVFTLTMFIVYTLYWTLDVYLLWVKYQAVLRLPQLKRAATRALATQMHLKGAPSTDGLPAESYPVLFVQWSSGLTLIVLGDFVSLWRAWVIFGKPRWLYVLLVCAAATESLIFVMLFISTTPAFFAVSPTFLRATSKIRVPLTFCSYSSAGLAQLGSTSLIAYKAWAQWRDVRAFMQRSTIPRSVAVMLIVIESGLVYIALLAWYGFIDFFGKKTWIVVSTCRFYSIPLVAMYPTLVIVLVACRHSVLEPSVASTNSLDEVHRTGRPTVRQQDTNRIRYPTFVIPHKNLDDWEIDLDGDSTMRPTSDGSTDDGLAQMRHKDVPQAATSTAPSSSYLSMV